MDNSLLKFCIKCEEEKLKHEFHTDNLRKDGLFPYCKECRGCKKRKTMGEQLKNYKVSDSGCWEWQGTKMIREDYGILCFGGSRYRVHRVSYMYHVGQIASGMLICHKCDNPICMNPEHLFQGTLQDNVDDMVRKNRQSRIRGEDNVRSKLTAGKVIEIRAIEKPHKEIAEMYGIAKSTVSGIKCRTNWSHIK